MCYQRITLIFIVLFAAAVAVAVKAVTNCACTTPVVTSGRNGAFEQCSFAAAALKGDWRR